ncbi:UPF0481 protein [Cinnamomum micranthum f. kanehirae]|uniref:UPF0481 protein n=1 Tax=Cinnamomum micranthum f. kanehirae TaxID=337451 RepID=A0A3S3QZ45_9MAGN|nr:UPF0481 protein [Cinnamomum micranthum f. kanehirae]
MHIFTRFTFPTLPFFPPFFYTTPPPNKEAPLQLQRQRRSDVREIERLATTVTEHIMLHEDEEGVELWKKHSIYKVPVHVVAVNPEAFKPKVVSIGPYHHGKDHLKPMEVHKQRAARCFIRYSRKNHRGLYQGFVESSAKVDGWILTAN